MTQNSDIFPLEKILTISAGDYISLMHLAEIEEDSEKAPSATYKPVGVNIQGAFESGGEGCRVSIKGDIYAHSTVHEAFASVVPREAEVVVNYVISYVGDKLGNFTAQGTALIPVKRKGVGECVSLIP
ncbi:MAG: hypothetical protein AABY10_05090 [Nanoarchaeota archaeon]